MNQQVTWKNVKRVWLMVIGVNDIHEIKISKKEARYLLSRNDGFYLTKKGDDVWIDR